MDMTPSSVQSRQALPGLGTPRLLELAAGGDRAAWEQLVDRYIGLIWSITRDYRLSESDAADVTQTTWLRLLEHVERIEAPERLASWLATTARRECARVVAGRVRVVLAFDEAGLEQVGAVQPELDAPLLAEERARDVRAAVEALPPRWRELLELLMADPPVSYAEIAQRLGVPVGSIGPTRGRCLRRLRELLEPAVAV